ncbi:MAG: hypothetical protein ACI4U2_00560 [Christensenellaceae bacterium]
MIHNPEMETARTEEASVQAEGAEKKKKTSVRSAVKEEVKKVVEEAKRVATRQPEKKDTHVVWEDKLQLLVTVVNRSKAEFYEDLILSLGVNMQMTHFGHGSASREMLDYFGLADSDKAVIFSVIREDKIPDAMNTISEKFDTIRGGKGIAFTVPLNSVIGTLIFGFLSNNRKTVKR